MEAVLQTAVLSNATTAELHYLLACTSLSFAALTPNTHLWWTDGVTLPDSLRAKQKCYFYHYRPKKLDAFCITIVFAIPPHLANWPRWQDLNLQEHYTQLFPLVYIAVSI